MLSSEGEFANSNQLMEVVRWGEDAEKHGWGALPIQIRLQKNLARHLNRARFRPQIETYSWEMNAVRYCSWRQ